MKLDINFNEREERLLSELAAKKGMSMENLLKQAARFYQSVEVRLEQGEISPKDISALLGPSLPKGLPRVD